METIGYVNIREGIPEITKIIAGKLWVTEPKQTKDRIGRWLFDRYDRFDKDYYQL